MHRTRHVKSRPHAVAPSATDAEPAAKGPAAFPPTPRAKAAAFSPGSVPRARLPPPYRLLPRGGATAPPRQLHRAAPLQSTAAVHFAGFDSEKNALAHSLNPPA